MILTLLAISYLIQLSSGKTMLASIPSSTPAIQMTFHPQMEDPTEKQSSETNNKHNPNRIKEEPINNSKKTTEIQQKQDLTEIQQLKKRDQEVKTHEQAHLSAAGSLASGGASFTYTTGPNGVRYAVAGEVNIDTSVIENNPEAALRKADIIRRAALSPASPSAQDQLVASKANAMASKARVDLVELKQEEKQVSTKQSQDKSDTETGSQDAIDDKPISAPSFGSIIDLVV